MISSTIVCIVPILWVYLYCLCNHNVGVPILSAYPYCVCAHIPFVVTGCHPWEDFAHWIEIKKPEIKKLGTRAEKDFTMFEDLLSSCGRV